MSYKWPQLLKEGNDAGTEAGSQMMVSKGSGGTWETDGSGLVLYHPRMVALLISTT